MTTRLRNTRTGIVLSVKDAKVSRFDAEWVPADKPAPAAKAPAKSAAKK